MVQIGRTELEHLSGGICIISLDKNFVEFYFRMLSPEFAKELGVNRQGIDLAFAKRINRQIAVENLINRAREETNCERI